MAAFDSQLCCLSVVFVDSRAFGVLTSLQSSVPGSISVPGAFRRVPKEVAVRITDPTDTQWPVSPGDGTVNFIIPDNDDILINIRYDANRDALPLSNEVRVGCCCCRSFCRVSE